MSASRHLCRARQRILKHPVDKRFIRDPAVLSFVKHPARNSRPGTNSSATISGVRSAASIIAFVHASCVFTIATPALDPLARGFATSGKFNLTVARGLTSGATSSGRQ